jgi:hypothetical protein
LASSSHDSDSSPGFGVPEKIFTIATCSKSSATYRALCGEDLANYAGDVLSVIISDVKVYVEIARDLGLEDEVAYCNKIIDAAEIARGSA